MSVLRIVTNLQTDRPQDLALFYEQIFGLEKVMDFGWITTSTTNQDARVQVSFASEGGSGTPVPALSIEVDEIEDTLSRARDHGIDIEYGPVDEPWGVRRFFIRDPQGNLLNVLAHTD